MAKEISVPEGNVWLLAQRVDDGAGIFVDNEKKKHVNFNESGEHKLLMQPERGYDVRFELWNLTGGAYHGVFRILDKDKREVYHADPSGQGGPAAVAWQQSVYLTCSD